MKIAFRHLIPILIVSEIMGGLGAQRSSSKAISSYSIHSGAQAHTVFSPHSIQASTGATNECERENRYELDVLAIEGKDSFKSIYPDVAINNKGEIVFTAIKESSNEDALYVAQAGDKSPMRVSASASPALGTFSFGTDSPAGINDTIVVARRVLSPKAGITARTELVTWQRNAAGSFTEGSPVIASDITRVYARPVANDSGNIVFGAGNASFEPTLRTSHRSVYTSTISPASWYPAIADNDWVILTGNNPATIELFRPGERPTYSSPSSVTRFGTRPGIASSADVVVGAILKQVKSLNGGSAEHTLLEVTAIDSTKKLPTTEYLLNLPQLNANSMDQRVGVSLESSSRGRFPITATLTYLSPTQADANGKTHLALIAATYQVTSEVGSLAITPTKSVSSVVAIEGVTIILPTLGSVQLSDIRLYDHPNKSGQIAFTAVFNNGKRAIVRATPSKDSDGDGLLDTWEEYGACVRPNPKAHNQGLKFIDLPKMGADKLHADIFVHLDYMKGRALSEKALDIVVEAFNNSPYSKNPDGKTGIHLHIDQGINRTLEVYDGGISLVTWGDKKLSRAEEVGFKQYLGAAITSGIEEVYIWNEFDALKNRVGGYTDAGRDQIFHYTVAANDVPLKDGISGISRSTPGSDFLLSFATVEKTKYKDRDKYAVEAGTFMHELGHNLGLRHGGGDELNFKPNYPSVMNYSHQDGIFVQGYEVFNYSHGLIPDLDETALSEMHPLTSPAQPFTTQYFCPNTSGKKKTGPDNSSSGIDIDWNCNYTISNTPVGPLDINGDGTNTDVLKDFNDWANLKFNGGTIGGGVSASDLPSQTPLSEEPLPDPQPALWVSDVAVWEYANQAVFTVTMSEKQELPVTVSLQTLDGNALAGSDFSSSIMTLTFDPSATSITGTVKILDNSIREDDETFRVAISAVSNADIAKGFGVITVINDDIYPRATATPTLTPTPSVTPSPTSISTTPVPSRTTEPIPTTVEPTLPATATIAPSPTVTEPTSQPPPSQIINRWQPTAGGSWNVATNWSLGHQPWPTETVVIDVEPGVTITVDGPSIRSAELRVNGNLDIQTEIEVSRSSTISGNIMLAAKLVANGDLSIKKDLNWIAGSIGGKGKVSINGQVLMIERNTRYLLTTLQVNGTGLWTAGDLSLAYGRDAGTLIIGENGRFTLDGPVTLTNDGGKLINYGVLLKNGAANTLIRVPVDNAGDLHVVRGELKLWATDKAPTWVNNSGRFIVEGSASLNIVGARTEIREGATLSGGGAITFESATVAITGNIRSLGRLEAQNSTVQFLNSQPITATNLHVVNSGIELTNDLFVTGTLDWYSGAIVANSSAKGKVKIVVSGRLLSIHETPFGKVAPVLDGVDLIHSGYNSLLAGMFYANQGATFTNTGQLVVSSTIPFETIADVPGFHWCALTLTSCYASGTQPSFINMGVITKTGSGVYGFDFLKLAFEAPAPRFLNLGTLFVESGQLNFGSDFVQSRGTTYIETEATLSSLKRMVDLVKHEVVIDDIYTLQYESGQLTGRGEIDGNLLSAAIVQPGGSKAFGVLTIKGTYEQLPAGKLEIDVGGTIPGVSLDRLHVTGESATATLSGTIEIVLTSGFVPSTGQSFVVIDYPKRNGVFEKLIDPRGGTLKYTNDAVEWIVPK